MNPDIHVLSPARSLDTVFKTLCDNMSLSNSGSPVSVTSTRRAASSLSSASRKSTTFTTFPQSIMTSTSAMASTIPTFSSSIPVSTIATFATSISASASTITTKSPTSTASAAASSISPSIVSQSNIVCIGHGLDVSATGLIATVVLPSAVGLILWVRRVHLTLPNDQSSLFCAACIRNHQTSFSSTVCIERMVRSTGVSVRSSTHTFDRLTNPFKPSTTTTATNTMGFSLPTRSDGSISSEGCF